MKPLLSHLPPQFADLEPWVSDWSLATENERYEKRENSTFDEIQAFYNAMVPRSDAATSYLDEIPLDQFSAQDKRLMYLLYSLVTIAFAVEVWKQPKTPDTGSAKLVSAGEPWPI